MRNLSEVPSSVYRVQLSHKFPLKKVIGMLKYLSELGVEGLYMSPIFDSTAHGYDVEDPNNVNPDLGTKSDFEALCKELQNLGMKQILDVVPNHMGIKGKKNKWWLDVLKQGPMSSYAPFFDINWDHSKQQLKNKILLPILKDPYGKVLEEGAIKLVSNNGFWIVYGDYELPLTQESEAFVRAQGVENFQGKKGDPKSFDLLHELLEKQFYRLAHWIVAGQEINYRRFFNINELVAIHIENEDVLKPHHKWVFELLDEKKIQGLRIDHPDGLYDPTQYFERLKDKKADLVFVEKVLDYNETLSEKWKVEGTVGYEYLNILNGLFVEKKKEKIFTKIYERFIGHKIDYETLIYERKKWFTRFYMGSEINALGEKLDKISEKNRQTRDFTKNDLSKAIQEVIACFPVYRTYVNPYEEVRGKDSLYVTQAVAKAKEMAPEIDPIVFDYLRDILLMKFGFDKEINDFVFRFQQITAPAMAKGLEDSVYYIYNRLLSLNEVGNNPQYFGVSKGEFHDFNIVKQKKYPLGLLPTSTHDTKRSEDARMRLNVLSEMPAEWNLLLNSWKKENAKHKKHVHGILCPDANTEYYIYQMLLSMWSAEISFERIWQCLLKSLREAGIYTNWRHINEEYEKGVEAFLKTILASDNPFLSTFLKFQAKVDHFGLLNSLSELVLKLGSPGIVDIYQGNETFTYRLMDPDNREPLDYNKIDKNNLKYFVTHIGLLERKKHKDLFLNGEYIPLIVKGNKKENVIAFARGYEKQLAIIVSARFFTQLDRQSWDDTVVHLPSKLQTRTLRNIFTNQAINISKRENKLIMPLKEVFSENPFAILL